MARDVFKICLKEVIMVQKDRLRIVFYILLLFVVSLSLSACSNDSEIRAQNDSLKALLPNEVGYVWMYEGFAEYFQVMEIEAIENEGNGYRYRIRGSVVDMSDGESNLDFRFTVEYVIQEGALVQHKQEEVMMDSIFDEIELVRFPLEKGATWQQTQTDRDGNQRTMTCTIEDATTVAGSNVYIITYQDEDSEYYEKRELRSGIGVYRVETLWLTDDGNFPLEYNLYRSLGPAENT
jgi:hypothetical protein